MPWAWPKLFAPNRRTSASMVRAIDSPWDISLGKRARQTNLPRQSAMIPLRFSGARQMIPRCTTTGCRFPRGEIPVFITDNEVFRYLPTVVIGTVDKLAAIGNQRKFALVFGQVDGRCRLHGYYKGICCQKECKDPSLLKA